MNDNRSKEIQLWGRLQLSGDRLTLYDKVSNCCCKVRGRRTELTHTKSTANQKVYTTYTFCMQCVQPKFKHISCVHTSLNTSNLSSANTTHTLFIKGGQPESKTHATGGTRAARGKEQQEYKASSNQASKHQTYQMWCRVWAQ